MKQLLLATLTVSSLLIAEEGMAQNELDDRTKRVLTETINLAKSEDSFRAFAHIEASGNPGEVVTWYSTLVRLGYSQEKNVPLMAAFGRRGIQYGLEQAGRTESDELADKLRSTAKEISFNLGANTWPGWDEGIVITATDLAVGLDAARTNLRLARELKRDAGPLSNAHWLLGAHYLAANDLPQATGEFAKSAELNVESKNPEGEWMSRGYEAIVQQLNEKTRADGDKSLAAAVTKLREIGSDDAKFFADQLESVSRFFLRRPPVRIHETP